MEPQLLYLLPQFPMPLTCILNDPASLLDTHPPLPVTCSLNSQEHPAVCPQLIKLLLLITSNTTASSSPHGIHLLLSLHRKGYRGNRFQPIGFVHGRTRTLPGSGQRADCEHSDVSTPHTHHLYTWTFVP
jgi:hypothetical protein